MGQETKLKLGDIKVGMRVKSEQLSEILDTYIILSNVKLVKNRIGIGDWEGTISAVSKEPISITQENSVLIYHDYLDGEIEIEY